MARVVQFAMLSVLAPENRGDGREEAMVFDRAEFLNRVEHDEDLARELLGIFQTESAANRKTLRAAVAERSADATRNAAHAFKGMLEPGGEQGFSGGCATGGAGQGRPDGRAGAGLAGIR